MAARVESAERRAEECAARCAAKVAELSRIYAESDGMAVPTEAFTELGAHVGDLAVALRAAEMPPEMVVVRVKRIVHNAASAAGVDSRLMMEPTVTCAIKAYFSPS